MHSNLCSASFHDADLMLYNKYRLWRSACETVLVPRCPKYFNHSCLNCFMYTICSQCIPSGSWYIWSLSGGIRNIPTQPCDAFIEHETKIVCLNCYLGSVNTSGQQELKLNSVLTRASFPSLRPHQHLITVKHLPRFWARRSLVWAAAPPVCRCSIYTDDSDTHVEWKFPEAEWG